MRAEFPVCLIASTSTRTGSRVRVKSPQSYASLLSVPLDLSLLPLPSVGVRPPHPARQNERAARPYTPQVSLTSPIPGQGCTLPAQRWFLLDLHGNRADRCRNPKGLSAIASATIPSDAVLRAACLHMGQTHVSEMVTASATPTAAQNVMIVTAIAFLKVVAAAPSVTLRPMGPTLAARPALQGVGVTTARVRQRTMSAAVRNGMTEA